MDAPRWSPAHPIDLADSGFERQDYDKFVAYGRSKAANVLMTVELEDRVGERGVHGFAVHPGVVATGLARYMTRDDFSVMAELSAGRPGMLRNPKSIAAGAATSVWAAVEPALERLGGAYLADCGVAVAEGHATDRGTARALWELSERLVAQVG